MKISGVGSYSVSPKFTAVNEQPKEEEKNKIDKIKEKATEFYKENKTSGMVVATALAAATISGALVRRNMKKTYRLLENSYRDHIHNLEEPFKRKISELEDTLKEKTAEVKGLKKNNDELFTLNRKLNNESDAISTKLDEILDDELPPEEIRTRIYNELDTAVKQELDYDPLNPPVTGKASSTAEEAKKERVNLPERKPTTNRSNLKELEIPEIKEDGSFEYQIPYSDAVKTSKMKSIDFKPRKDFVTNVGEGYADSVEWNNDKIARDILQNFYDGHGQTLDGVRIKFTPAEGGKYKVRIEGDSTYTADKAVIIGESTKREDFKAAGNYGEGLKMASLKLLRDKGAKEVKIGSDNWDLRFKLMDDDLSGKQVIGYDLDKSPAKKGNYIEFETDDRSLLDTIKTTINRFYHSGNADFKCPDFENDLFGIKLLKPKTKKLGAYSWDFEEGEKGKMYIAGQAFEFDGNFQGLEGATLFLKERTPKGIFDTSRDRTSVNKDDLRKIMSWFASRMSNEEKVQFITAMEPLWKLKNWNETMPVDDMFGSFLQHMQIVNRNEKNALLINFPKDRYVAYSDATNEIVADLTKKGYIVCNDKMSYLGMQTIRDLLGDARAHTPIKPNAGEAKKINIIKEAFKIFEEKFKKEGYDISEINTKLYMFDRNADKERRMSGDSLAEALIDGHVSKGFWIDKQYLHEDEFGEVLETALHELSHVAGGDESMEFSYKLTDVNKRVLEQICEDPQTRAKLKILNKLWKDASNETFKAE